MHIIVTGSRTLGQHDDTALNDLDWSAIFRQLDWIHRNVIISSVTQGAAKGADEIAKSWAEFNQIATHDFPADWGYFQQQGNPKAAGPVRNRHMIRETIKRFGTFNSETKETDVSNITVVAFTDKPLIDSKGTLSCVKTAFEKGLDIKHYVVSNGTTQAMDAISLLTPAPR